MSREGPTLSLTCDFSASLDFHVPKLSEYLVLHMLLMLSRVVGKLFNLWLSLS